MVIAAAMCTVKRKLRGRVEGGKRPFDAEIPSTWRPLRRLSVMWSLRSVLRYPPIGVSGSAGVPHSFPTFESSSFLPQAVRDENESLSRYHIY